MKSNRDITRAVFRGDLAENYGLVARGLDDAAEVNRNLVKISNDSLPANLRAQADEAAGDSWYLPKEHHKVLDGLENLSRVTTDAKWVRFFRKMTNFFRSATTVYNPGYHTRNMMSDVMMGIFDGIGWKPYYDLLNPRKITLEKVPGKRLRRIAPKAGATVKIGPGWTITMHELWAMFKNNASSGGFVTSDIARSPIARGVGKVNQVSAKVSEMREDFGRVAHFLGALRQEYRVGKEGVRGVQAAQDKAIEQAVYRVNHYKFDYGALTKWEQKSIKPFVPFYTFTRKAVPTVLENYMMNPKWIHRNQLMRESMDQDENKNFPTWALQPWQREVGYATIQDEKEPWLFTYEGLPGAIPGNVLPGDKSVRNIAQNITSQINPYVQAPFELTAGREIFTGKPIDNYVDYVTQKFGGPGGAAVRAKESSNRGLTPLQIGLTSRLGLGLPLHKVSSEQQEYQGKLWEDRNIEAPFDRFNEGEGSETGIRIYTSKSTSSGRSSYRVKDTKTDRELYQGNDPFKALKVAKEQQGTPELDMSLDEWNDTVGAPSNIRVYWSDRKKGSSYRVRNTRTNSVIGDYKDVELRLTKSPIVEPLRTD